MLDRLNWLNIETFWKYPVMILIEKIKNGITSSYLTEKLIPIISSMHIQEEIQIFFM